MKYIVRKTIRLAPSVYLLRGSELDVFAITVRPDASGFVVPFLYSALVEDFGAIFLPATLVDRVPYLSLVEREEPIEIRVVGAL